MRVVGKCSTKTREGGKGHPHHVESKSGPLAVDSVSNKIERSGKAPLHAHPLVVSRHIAVATPSSELLRHDAGVMQV